MKVMKSTRLIKITILLILYFMPIYPVRKGSDSKVSVQPYFTFPASGSNALPPNDNRMLSFGFFKSGFGLQDATTTCTFSSTFPVSGTIQLNGGQLFLADDLLIQNPTNLLSSGFINGNGHTLELSESVNNIPSSFPTTLRNVFLSLKSDTVITGTLKIIGNCTITGLKDLYLQGGGNIQIAKNSTLKLQNITINGGGNQRIHCLDNTGKLILENVQWIPDGDVRFTLGGILFDDQVNIFGPYGFSYSSPITSTINKNSSLIITNMDEFLIGRSKGKGTNDPLKFTDQTSTLMLENTTLHTTSSGMRLTNGTINILGAVDFICDAKNKSNAFQLGNGNIANDMLLVFSNADSFATFNSGAVVYNNVSQNIFFSNILAKKFIINNNVIFFIDHNITFQNTDVTFVPGLTSIYKPGVEVTYKNASINDTFAQYNISGHSTPAPGYVLEQNDFITLNNGFFVQPVYVQGPASLGGVGDFLTPIIITNSPASLNVNLLGTFSSDIYLEGGTLIAGHDIRFENDSRILGAGRVLIPGTNDISIHLKDNIWTSTLIFAGGLGGGTLTLRSDIVLSSALTFSGDCEIHGQGYSITLVGNGSINVERGSLLSLQNVNIENVKGTNLACNDDLASIEFRTVVLRLSDDYLFKKGSFSVRDSCLFQGNDINLVYQTSMTSTVDFDSLLIFDSNLTFSYEPRNQQSNLLFFQDNTAGIVFNSNSTIFIPGEQNLELQKGQVVFNGVVNLFAGDGLLFGDNSNANNDMNVLFPPGSVLATQQGTVTYQNIDQESWQMNDGNSTLRMFPETTLIVNRDLNLGFGQLLISRNATLQQNNGAQIIGTVNSD